MNETMTAKNARDYHDMLANGNDKYLIPVTRQMHAGMRDAIDALRAEVERLRASQQWQPIETAPTDGTPILTCLGGECYTGHGFLPVSVRWETFHPNAKGKATWRASHGYKVERLTHWMPLPEPPAERGEG